MSIILPSGKIKHDLLINENICSNNKRWVKPYEIKLEPVCTSELANKIFKEKWDKVIILSPYIKKSLINNINAKEKKIITTEDNKISINTPVYRVKNLHLKGIILERENDLFFYGGSTNFTEYGFFHNIELNYKTFGKNVEKIEEAISSIINFDIFEWKNKKENNFEFPTYDLLNKIIGNVEKINIISPFVQKIPEKTAKIFTSEKSIWDIHMINEKYFDNTFIITGLHAKITEIINEKNKEACITGSGNWTNNSNTGRNKELDILIKDEENIKKMKETFINEFNLKYNYKNNKNNEVIRNRSILYNEIKTCFGLTEETNII